MPRVELPLSLGVAVPITSRLAVVLVVDAAPDTAELVELAADQFDWFMVRRAFAVLPGRG